MVSAGRSSSVRAVLGPGAVCVLSSHPVSHKKTQPRISTATAQLRFMLESPNYVDNTTFSQLF
jgi:hypothetical protein